MAETVVQNQLSDPETWLEQHGDVMYRYALLRVRDPSLAEDLVQETLLGGIHSRKNYNGTASERNWLFGILKHKIVDYFRKVSREHPIEDLEAKADNMINEKFDGKGHWLKGPADWKTNPSLELEQVEFHKTMNQCLGKLPQRTAQAFILRELEGMNGPEICKVLNITPANFWVMLYRARMSLRECLETQWLHTKQTTPTQYKKGK